MSVRYRLTPSWAVKTSSATRSFYLSDPRTNTGKRPPAAKHTKSFRDSQRKDSEVLVDPEEL
jgi:hypothetical protein